MTCWLCWERQDDILNHLRLFHPDMWDLCDREVDPVPLDCS